MTCTRNLRVQRRPVICKYELYIGGKVNVHTHRVKLKHFSKFGDMTDALSAATAAVEGKMNKGLKKLLKKVFSLDVQDQLAVADAKLGNVIKVSRLKLGHRFTSCVF